MQETKQWFFKHDYPQNIVDHDLRKVGFSKLPRRANKRDKVVCLVATYHPLLKVGFFIDTLIGFMLIKKLK